MMNGWLPMVLVVLVSLDGVVVDQVEQGREAHSSLDEGGESTVFGKTILMIPSAGKGV